MKALIEEFIPHAPQLGLYVAPGIPASQLASALKDYAKQVHRDEVLALYDATLMGSARDGAVFLGNRLVYQNNRLEPAQEIRYHDIVRIENKRRLLGGRQVLVDVNRGRATVTHMIDFSGKSEAAQYVTRFLHEAMLQSAGEEGPNMESASGGETDIEAVRSALQSLRDQQRLTEVDYRKMMAALETR